MYLQNKHYGTEYYGAGTAALTVKCKGERDLLCSAGDGQITVTIPGHIQSFGIPLALIGCCKLSLPTTTHAVFADAAIA